MNTKTISILIGNSDNKLSQYEWSRFILNCVDIVESYAKDMYFKGSSPSESQFQNHCVVFAMEKEFIDIIRRRLAILAKHYNQDTIAILVGESELIKAATNE